MTAREAAEFAGSLAGRFDFEIRCEREESYTTDQFMERVYVTDYTVIVLYPPGGFTTDDLIELDTRSIKGGAGPDGFEISRYPRDDP